MIHSLRHFALGVPDLKAGSDFYTTFGLNQQDARSNELRFRCGGRDHDEVVLYETGKGRKFHHLSFGATAKGLDDIANKLRERGIALEKAPSPDAEGIWFHDPDGALVNVLVAVRSSAAKETTPVVNYPGAIVRTDRRGCPPFNLVAKPRRLGHIILFTPDVARKRQFYCDILGMQLSDTIVDNYAAFLRAPGGSDHHVLAFLNSPAPGFHHASFEVASIDEAEAGAKALREKQFQHAWGPGRHGVGSNYFHYFRDPWNGMAEYFFDMDFVSKDEEWQAVDWTKKDGMFLWSADGPPPPDFGRNYEHE